MRICISISELSLETVHGAVGYMHVDPEHMYPRHWTHSDYSAC